MGSRLVLDGDDLFIENPENIYLELEEFVKSYKQRIIQYLQGGYSNHSVKQTIDKIADFYRGAEQAMNPKINDWLNHDDKASRDVMNLFVLFSNNGWSAREPVANYEDMATDDLSQEIDERAMSYFKGK
jgi:hypothetical protein